MRVGILTGGGDCPALNAVVRAAVKTSVGYGWEAVGIEEGFDGLVHCKTRPLDTASVSGFLHLGGTILSTTNAANPFIYPTPNTRNPERDVSDIVIGGDGSLGIAQKFYDLGIPLVGIPRTIDK